MWICAGGVYVYTCGYCIKGWSPTNTGHRSVYTLLRHLVRGTPQSYSTTPTATAAGGAKDMVSSAGVKVSIGRLQRAIGEGCWCGATAPPSTPAAEMYATTVSYYLC